VTAALRSESPDEGTVALDETIRSLFATLLQVAPEQVDERSSPDTLERWDSMQHLILVSGFEEELGIDVDPEEAVDMYESYAVFQRMVLKKLHSRP